jgi:hypothetical protein
MTINEALRSVNAYPIPERTINEVCERRGLDPCAEAGFSILEGDDFKLAKADLLLWLSYAPNVSQGGQSYTFTDEQRKQMRDEAAGLLDEFGEDETPKTRYGYKGSVL